MDSITTLPAERVRQTLLQRAHGFVVTLSCANAGTQYLQHVFCDEWRDARECYVEPPSGYHFVGMSACDESGIPFAKLDTWDLAQLRSGR